MHRWSCRAGRAGRIVDAPQHSAAIGKTLQAAKDATASQPGAMDGNRVPGAVFGQIPKTAGLLRAELTTDLSKA